VKDKHIMEKMTPPAKYTGGQGCGCSGGRRTRKAKKGGQLSPMPVSSAKTAGRRRRHRGGSMLGDVLLSGTALGLYSYFTKKRGGKRSRKH
jgi:hypothetical protein